MACVVLAALGPPAEIDRVEVKLSERGRSAEVTVVYRMPSAGRVALLGVARPVRVTQGGADLDVDFETREVTVPRAGAPLSLRYRVVGEPSAGPSRKLAESSHALHARADPLTYSYAFAAPPSAIEVPPGLDVTARGANLAVTSARAIPVALEVAVGIEAHSGEHSGGAAGFDPRVRGALDLLLSRDVIALGVESSFSSVVSLALTYQLHSAYVPYLRMGGHAEVGPVIDLGQGVSRAGGRAGGALHVLFVQMGATVDGFADGWRAVGWVGAGI